MARALDREQQAPRCGGLTMLHLKNSKSVLAEHEVGETERPLSEYFVHQGKRCGFLLKVHEFTVC